MKKQNFLFLICLLLSIPQIVWAQAPISDSSFLANLIKQVGQDTKELTGSVNKLKNSTLTLASLGMIGDLGDFSSPLSTLGENALSEDVVGSVSGGSGGSTKTGSAGSVTESGDASSGGTAAANGENSAKFPPPGEVRTNVAANLQLPTKDEGLNSTKVAAVRANFPKTKAAIATYGIATSWVNRTIATRNIEAAKTEMQKKSNETQDNRKAITAKTSTNTNIAETYNRLLMSGATANALSAINTMEQAGNLQ